MKSSSDFRSSKRAYEEIGDQNSQEVEEMMITRNIYKYTSEFAKEKREKMISKYQHSYPELRIRSRRR
jgi:hypothetical protein